MRKKQEINGEIGQRIKAARERAGFTQDRLAKLTDVGVPYLAKLETGKVGISLPNFINFCSVLGVSADYLIWGDRGRVIRQSLWNGCATYPKDNMIYWRR